MPPDLRPTVFSVVGRYADSQTWEKLHRLGEKTTSTEEKGNYYEALGHATSPALISRYLEISLGDELPTSRASAILGFSARYGEHPDLVWDFAKAHMKALLAKQDALGVNNFAPGLFNFYSDPKDIQTLEAYAKGICRLPPLNPSRRPPMRLVSAPNSRSGSCRKCRLGSRSKSRLTNNSSRCASPSPAARPWRPRAPVPGIRDRAPARRASRSAPG